MKARFYLILALILILSSACSDRRNKSALEKIGAKSSTPVAGSGSNLSPITGYEQDKLDSLLTPAAPYYLVTAKMTNPFNWYLYESTKDPSIKYSAYLEPPVGQTCFDGDTFKCAREGNWRLVARMPCGIELQLIFGSFKNGETKDLEGIKETLSCDHPLTNWNSATN